MALGNSNWVNPWMTADSGNLSVNNWVPDVFSKKLQAKFYSTSVVPQITNTDYQGEISGQGGKVVIRTVPTIAVADYAGSVTYTDPQSDTVELLIDKAKSYAFRVDDILKAQADIDFWSAASKDAAEQMRITVERDVLGYASVAGGILAGAAATVSTPANTLGSTADTNPTPQMVLDAILDAARTLDEANIPETDRFLVIGPKQVQALKGSDLKFAYLTGDAKSPLRSGYIGDIDRFKVYWSNNLHYHSTADANQFARYCIAGHKKFACFASQFVKTETVRLESTFGDGVRGLKVYGYKAIVPTAGVVVKISERNA